MLWSQPSYCAQSLAEATLLLILYSMRVWYSPPTQRRHIDHLGKIKYTSPLMRDPVVFCDDEWVVQYRDFSSSQNPRYEYFNPSTHIRFVWNQWKATHTGCCALRWV